MATKAKSTDIGLKGAIRREVSAGGVVYCRRSEGATEVAVVRPAGKDSWVLPKGHQKRGESLEQAAVRETEEETGLKVELEEILGTVSYIFSERASAQGAAIRIFKRVHFFLMSCKGGRLADHDHEITEARWVSIDEALALLSYDNERKLVQKARTILTG